MLHKPLPEPFRVAVVALARSQSVGDSDRLEVGDGGHPRSDLGGHREAVVVAVAEAAGHDQSAEVRVAQTQRAVLVAAILDLLRRVAGQVHDDVQRRGHHPADLLKLLVVEDEAARVPVVVQNDRVELHQVDRGQVAGGVVQEQVLAARVRGVDFAVVGDGVPVVDGVDELNAGIAAFPRSLSRRQHDLAGVIAPVHQVHVFAFVRPFDQVHEFVGDADGMVRVLKRNRGVGLAVDRAVVAGCDQRVSLLFLVLLAVDELVDVLMVGVEQHHFCRSARFAAGLDHVCEGVVAAHERHRATRGSAARDLSATGTEWRQVRAAP